MATPPDPREFLASLGVRRLPNTSLTVGPSAPTRPVVMPTRRTQSPPRQVAPPSGTENTAIGRMIASGPPQQAQDDQPWYKDLGQAVLGNGVVQGALKPLDWLQTGGRAAVAGYENLARALPEGWEKAIDAPATVATAGLNRALGIGIQDINEDRELEGSWWDRATTSEYGWGTASKDGAGLWDEALGDKWGNRWRGFTGDVMFDPTTWLTAGSAQAAGKTARLGLAGKAALAGFDDDLVRTIGTKGVAWLDDAKRAELGVERAGVRFAGQRIPLSGGVARNVGKATSTVRHQALGRRPWQFVANSRTRGLAVDVTEARKVLSDVNYRGSMTPRQAGVLLAFDDAVRREGMTIANTSAHIVHDSFDGKSDAERVLMTHAREAGEDSPLAALYDHFKQLAEDNGIEMGSIDNYVPHIWTKEARDALKRMEVIGPNGSEINLIDAAGATKKRGITKGKYKINGQEVVFKEGTVKEINEVLSARLPEMRVAKWLEDDARKLADEYIAQMSTTIGSAKALKETIEQAPDVMNFLDAVGNDVIDFAATSLKSKKLKQAFEKAAKRRKEMEAQELVAARDAAVKLQADVLDRMDAVVDEALGRQRLARTEAELGIRQAKADKASFSKRAKEAEGRLAAAAKRNEAELKKQRAALAKIDEELAAAKVEAAARPTVKQAGKDGRGKVEVDLWTATYEKNYAIQQRLQKLIEQGEADAAKIAEAQTQVDYWLAVADTAGQRANDPDYLVKLMTRVVEEDVVERRLAEGATPSVFGGERVSLGGEMSDAMRRAEASVNDRQAAVAVDAEADAIRASTNMQEQVGELEGQLAAVADGVKWARVRIAEAKRRVTAAADAVLEARAREVRTRNGDGRFLAADQKPTDWVPRQINTMGYQATDEAPVISGAQRARDLLVEGAGEQRVGDAIEASAQDLIDLAITSHEAFKAAKLAFDEAAAAERPARAALRDLLGARPTSRVQRSFRVGDTFELRWVDRTQIDDVGTEVFGPTRREMIEVEGDAATRAATPSTGPRSKVQRRRGRSAYGDQLDAVRQADEAKRRALEAYDAELAAFEKAAAEAEGNAERLAVVLSERSSALMEAERAANAADAAVGAAARRALPPEEAALLDQLIELDRGFSSLNAQLKRQRELERRVARAKRVGTPEAMQAAARRAVDADLRRIVMHNQSYTALDFVDAVVGRETRVLKPMHPSTAKALLDGIPEPKRRVTLGANVEAAIRSRGVEKGRFNFDELVTANGRIDEATFVSAPEEIQQAWMKLTGFGDTSDDARAAFNLGGAEMQSRARFLADWMGRHKRALDAGAEPSEALSAEITRRVLTSEIEALDKSATRRAALVKSVSDELLALRQGVAAAEAKLVKLRRELVVAKRKAQQAAPKSDVVGAPLGPSRAMQVKSLREEIRKAEQELSKAEARLEEGIPLILADSKIGKELKEEFDEFLSEMLVNVHIAKAKADSIASDSTKAGASTGTQSLARGIPSPSSVSKNPAAEGGQRLQPQRVKLDSKGRVVEASSAFSTADAMWAAMRSRPEFNPVGSPVRYPTEMAGDRLLGLKVRNVKGVTTRNGKDTITVFHSDDVKYIGRDAFDLIESGQTYKVRHVDAKTRKKLVDAPSVESIKTKNGSQGDFTLTREQWEEGGRPRVNEGSKWDQSGAKKLDDPRDSEQYLEDARRVYNAALQRSGVQTSEHTVMIDPLVLRDAMAEILWETDWGQEILARIDVNVGDAVADAALRKSIKGQAVSEAKSAAEDFAASVRAIAPSATNKQIEDAIRDGVFEPLWEKASSRGRLSLFDEVVTRQAADATRRGELRKMSKLLGSAEDNSRVASVVDADWRHVTDEVLGEGRAARIGQWSTARAQIEEALAPTEAAKAQLLWKQELAHKRAMKIQGGIDELTPSADAGAAAKRQLEGLRTPDDVVGEVTGKRQAKVAELEALRAAKGAELNDTIGRQLIDIAVDRAEAEQMTQAAVAAEMRLAFNEASADAIDTYGSNLASLTKKAARDLPKDSKAALKRVNDDTKAILAALKDDDSLADVAALHTTYQQQLVAAQQAGDSVAELEKAIKAAGATAKKASKNPDKNFVNVYKSVLDEAERKWVRFGEGSVKPDGRTVVVPPEVAQAFVRLHEAANDPEGLGLFLDRMTQFFKTYATATPGFHVRNAMSATFMNIAAGVSMASQGEAVRSWRQYRRNPLGYMKRISQENPDLYEAYKAAFGAGAGGNFSRAELGDHTSKAFDNWWTRKNREWGERVEGAVRVGMAYDVIRKGGSTADAHRMVEKYHFNYSKISDMDRNMKRVIPFWTFFSRNLPLQIQMMYMRPGAYTVWDHFADNMGTDIEAMPQWLADKEAIVTGGNDLEGYDSWAPDLPHLNLGADLETLDVRDPLRVLSNLNPVAVAPIEAISNKNFFYDGPLNREGEWGGMDGRAWHAASSIISPLAQGQRLSGTGRYEGRRLENWANIFGIPYRNISPERMAAEMRRRAYEGG